MTKITQFNRPQLRTLRDELQTELNALGARLGLNISAGNISYEQNACTIQVKAKINGKLTRNQQSISMHASLLGLNNLKYGSILQSARNGQVRLIDYKPRSPKYPWILELQNGNQIKTSDRGLQNMQEVTL